MDNAIKITSLNCRRYGLCSPQIPQIFKNTDLFLCQEIVSKNDMNRVKNEIISMQNQPNCEIFVSSVVNGACLLTFVKKN